MHKRYNVKQKYNFIIFSIPYVSFIQSLLLRTCRVSADTAVTCLCFPKISRENDSINTVPNTFKLQVL